MTVMAAIGQRDRDRPTRMCVGLPAVWVQGREGGRREFGGDEDAQTGENQRSFAFHVHTFHLLWLEHPQAHDGGNDQQRVEPDLQARQTKELNFFHDRFTKHHNN